MVLLSPSSVVTEFCDGFSLCSDREFVEPDGFSWSATRFGQLLLWPTPKKVLSVKFGKGSQSGCELPPLPSLIFLFFRPSLNLPLPNRFLLNLGPFDLHNVKNFFFRHLCFFTKNNVFRHGCFRAFSFLFISGAFFFSLFSLFFSSVSSKTGFAQNFLQIGPLRTPDPGLPQISLFFPSPATVLCLPSPTHTTHNTQTHNTQHRTRKVASSVLLTKICPRRVIT